MSPPRTKLKWRFENTALIDLVLVGYQPQLLSIAEHPCLAGTVHRIYTAFSMTRCGVAVQAATEKMHNVSSAFGRAAQAACKAAVQLIQQPPNPPTHPSVVAAAARVIEALQGVA